MNRTISTVTVRPPLLRGRGTADAGWFGGHLRSLRDWAFGQPEHPDAPLLSVIDTLADTMRIGIQSARAQFPAALQGRLDMLAADLDRAIAQPVPDLPAILGVDAALNALYPPEIAARRAWLIEERFQRVAASAAIQAWWLTDRIPAQPNGSSGKPSPAPDTTEADTNSFLMEAFSGLTNAAAELTAAEQDVAQATAISKAAGSLFDNQLTAVAGAQAAIDAGRIETLPSALRQAYEAKTAAEAALKRANDRQNVAIGMRDFAQKFVIAARAADALNSAKASRIAAEAALRQAQAAAAVQPADQALAAFATSKQTALDTAQKTEADAYTTAAQAAAAAGLNLEALGKRIPPRSDLQSLLNYIHNNYLLAIAREKAERDLKRWLAKNFWTGLAGGVVFLGVICTFVSLHFPAWRDRVIPVCIALLAVAAIGRIGALISISRRLQGAVADNAMAEDPIHELAALRAARPGIRMAMLSGSVFALLIYAMFVSGVPQALGLGGGMFPQSADSEKRKAVYDETRAEAELAVAAVKAQKACTRAAPKDVDCSDESARYKFAAAHPADTQSPVRDVVPPPPPPPPPIPAAAAPASSPPAPVRSEQNIQHSAHTGAHRPTRLSEQATVRPATIVSVDAQAPPPSPQAAAPPVLPNGPVTAPKDTQPGQGAATDDFPTLAREEATKHSMLEEAKKHLATMSAEPDVRPIDWLALMLGLAGIADLFKLILWAFIAGFAERFVPDALDRLVGQAQQRSAASILPRR